MKTSSKIAIVLLLFSAVVFSQQPENIFKKNKNGDLPATRLAVTKNLTNQAQILKQINIFRIEDGLTPINPDKANDFFANTLPQNIYDNADNKIIKANVNVPIERLPGFVAGEKYNLWQNLEVVKATVSNEGMQKYFQPILERFQLPTEIKKQLCEQFMSGKFEDYKLLPGSVLEQVAFLSPPYSCPTPLKTNDDSRVKLNDEYDLKIIHLRQLLISDKMNWNYSADRQRVLNCLSLLKKSNDFLAYAKLNPAIIDYTCYFLIHASNKFIDDAENFRQTFSKIPFIKAPRIESNSTHEGSGTATEPKINLYQKTVFLPFIGDNDPDYFTKNSLDFQFVSGSDDKYLYVVGIIRHQSENTADWTGLLNIFWYKVDVADLPIQPVKKAELSKKPTVIQEAEIVADAESQLTSKNQHGQMPDNLIIITSKEVRAFVNNNQDNILQISIDKEHAIDDKFFYRVKEVATASHMELGYALKVDGLSFDFTENHHLALISALILKDGRQVIIDDNFVGPKYSVQNNNLSQNISFAVSSFFKGLGSTFFTLYRSDYSDLSDWISLIKKNRDKIEYAIWEEPGNRQFRFIKIVDVPNAGHLEVSFTLKSQEGWGIDTKVNMNTLIAVLDINSDIAQQLFDYLRLLNYKIANYGGFNNTTQINSPQNNASNQEPISNNSWFTVSSQGEVMNLITKKDQMIQFTDGSKAIVTVAGEILAEGQHNANRWVWIKFVEGHNKLWGHFAAWAMGHISGIFISRDETGNDNAGLGEGGTGIINLSVRKISK